MEEASSSKFEGENSVKSNERADMLNETDPFFIDTAKWMNSMGQLLKEDPYTGQDGLFEWHNTFYNNEITESLYDSESDEEHSNHIDSLFLPALESYIKQDLEILNEIYQNVISVLVIAGKPIFMEKKYQEDIMETLRGLYDIYADHEPVKNDEMENNMITYSEYHAWMKYKSKYENGEIKCSISLWDNNKTHITKNWRADELKLDYYSNLNKASLLYQINFHNGLIQTRESLLSIFSHHLPDSYFVICFMEFIKFYLNICYEAHHVQYIRKIF